MASFPTNTTPAWKSYTDTGNKSDIVKSTTVATAIGLKIDATSGQSISQTLNNPSLSGGQITGTTNIGLGVSIATGGKTSRTLNDKSSDIISVKDFGAVGDGSTDDTSAIQAAINYTLTTNNSGGTVYLPNGNYLVSKTLTVGGSGVSIVGFSSTGTRITTNNLNSNILEFGTSSNNVEGNSVSGIGFAATSAMNTGAAIYSHGAVNLVIKNIRVIENVYDGIILNSDGGSSMGIYISDFDLKMIRNNGINIGPTSGVTDVFLQNGLIRPGVDQAYSGIHIVQGYGVYALNIDVTNFGSYYFSHGLEVAPSSNQQSNALIFSNVLFDSSVNENVLFDGSGTISDVQMVNCWANTSTSATGLTLSNSKLDGFLLSSSSVSSNETQGILVNSGKNIAINGCKIFSNSRKSSGGYDGVFVAAGVSHFSVTNNQLGLGGYFNTISAGGTQSHGVSVDTGASDDYIIALNRGFGNSSGIVNDNGTGSNKYVAGNVAGTTS